MSENINIKQNYSFLLLCGASVTRLALETSDSSLTVLTQPMFGQVYVLVRTDVCKRVCELCLSSLLPVSVCTVTIQTFLFSFRSSLLSGPHICLSSTITQVRLGG